MMPENQDQYSRMMKIAQIVAVIIAVLVLAFKMRKAEAHVDLCDPASVIERVRELAKEFVDNQNREAGLYEVREGHWRDMPDTGTFNDPRDSKD